MRVDASPTAGSAVRSERLSALGRLRSALPEGRTLPEPVWNRRHRALLGLLWLHALGLAVFAVMRGYGILHGLEEGLLIAVFAAAATACGERRKRLAAALVSVGLITSSAVLVHLWGGVIEAHFHFFVMIVLLSLYEDWLPFLVAAGYVVLHHGLMGAVDPGSVYNHGAAIEHPWRWAIIHGLFVTGAGIGAVAAWRLNEDVRAETQHAYDQVRESEERFKSAFANAPIGMSLNAVDPADAGRYLQVNSALCEITGYSEAELLERRFADITHPDDVEGSVEALERLLSGETSHLSVDKRYIHADGRVLEALVHISLVRDAAGEPAHTVVQVQDVTDRRRAHEQLAHQANHDALTGLPNRRKLMDDLDGALARASGDEPLLLVLFDLDGFKAYNDAFGHAAGDALLVRLGARLTAAVKGRATAYRMGGDEFCLLSTMGVDGPAPIAAAAISSLSEQGEGFTVTASHGTVIVPLEAAGAADALRLADQRMYARKGRGRSSPGQQATDALLTALSERNPTLGVHLDDVTELCEAVARNLALDEEQMTPLLQAAALHDIGKVAIPDAILEKPGALSAGEWEFMRTHTLIGERIVAAAPALADAARIVRWSHERHDGKGYPDGLAGSDIPLTSRIIAVCDAYDAMTSNRPYRTAMSHEGALAELKRCAGTQFDPAVVRAFASIRQARSLHL